MAAAFFLISSGITAYFWASHLTLPPDRSVRVLCTLVLWEILQLTPVHAMAALEITGSIKRVDLGALAWLQAFSLAMTCAWVLLRRRRPLVNSAHTPLVVT